MIRLLIILFVLLLSPLLLQSVNTHWALPPLLPLKGNERHQADVESGALSYALMNDSVGMTTTTLLPPNPTHTNIHFHTRSYCVASVCLRMFLEEQQLLQQDEKEHTRLLLPPPIWGPAHTPSKWSCSARVKGWSVGLPASQLLS